MVVDIPVAYLISIMDNDVLMIFLGKMVELMVAADPTFYPKYILYRTKSDVMLYMRVQKALYGCLKSALLFL